MASIGKNELPGKTGRESVYINWQHMFLKDFVPYDQKDTGTCWAFAISLCVSLLYMIEHGIPNDSFWQLSAQELIDRVCHNYNRWELQPPKPGQTWIFKEDAFNTYGIISRYGFLYCMDFGLSFEHDYPFAGKRNLGKSMPAEDELPRVYISGYDIKLGSASKHMDSILSSLKKHPLVGKLYATNEFRKSKDNYKGRDSGIEHLIETEHGVIATDAHSVLIVGYIGKLDCFLILNSWGKSFGEEGFLLVASKLMFDVGWPKKSFRVNRKDKDLKAKLPRKPQFSEHAITSASSNPPEVVRLEGHALYPEDMAFSRDMYSLQQLCSGLDDNAAGGCAQFVFAHIDKTCAVDAPLLMGSIQRVVMAIAPSRINTHMGSKQLSGSPDALTLLLWICRTYRVHIGADLIQVGPEVGEAFLQQLRNYYDGILCCSGETNISPFCKFANQAGLDMRETTHVALQDIILDKVLDEGGRKVLLSDNRRSCNRDMCFEHGQSPIFL